MGDTDREQIDIHIGIIIYRYRERERDKEATGQVNRKTETGIDREVGRRRQGEGGDTERGTRKQTEKWGEGDKEIERNRKGNKETDRQTDTEGKEGRKARN